MEKKSKGLKDWTLVEPFAGGAHITIGCLHSGLNPSKIVVNDLDKGVYSFWKSMSVDHQGLIDMMRMKSPATISLLLECKKVVSSEYSSELERGFAEFFISRTTWGATGNGPKGGYDQSGAYNINDRYNVKSLIDQIKHTASLFHQTHSVCLCNDYIDVIKEYDSESTVIYLDPPYLVKGDVLYDHTMGSFDFEKMANVLSSCKSRWVMNHEEHPDIWRLFGSFSNIFKMDDFRRETNRFDQFNKKFSAELAIVSRD
jgi:DNA adenine methylase